jgi:hypothetical protein
MTVRDFTGDGRLDILTIEGPGTATSTIHLLPGNGDGTFGPAVNTNVRGNLTAVQAADLNGDGILDIAITDFGNQLTILLGDGTGGFSVSQSLATGSDPVSIALGDLNGDGKLDIIVANNLDGTVGTYIGVGDGTFIAKAPQSAGFTDPGSHTSFWSWEEGSTSPGIVAESGGTGTVFGSHSYEVAGVYRATVTVTDGGGAFQDRASLFIVVYDPNGGFVTGGGWINSPGGAYTPSPLLTGKADFGFVSKYKKGTAPGAPPEGETQFHFNAAGLTFDSDSYEWLVISGAKARYRGTGAVNGVAGYGFELTAYDNSPDRFRIKIWFGNSGTVIYDNEKDSPDGEATMPSSVLGGGSIVIHKK